MEHACAEVASGHAVLGICQRCSACTEAVMQGVLILMFLVRVERLDEDADRIHVCLSRARKFTSLGTMEIA